jgi:uncharacterized protein (UPF0332 family)
MTLEWKDKKSLCDVRMAKAQEFLEDAQANYHEGRYKTSINRSYYAVISAARALLILEGINPLTHEGLITMLSLRFIKPRILPTAIIKKFKILLSRRTDVDYGDFDSTTARDAKDSVKLAQEILLAMDKVRNKLTKNSKI